MANHKSAIKTQRQIEKRTTINKQRISRIRTFVKKVEKAIGGGSKAAAQEAFQKAEPELRRGVNKGVFHLNTVSRKISRLSARIKAMA